MGTRRAIHAAPRLIIDSLRSLLAENRAAVHAMLAAAQAVRDWDSPLRPGAWSAGQHVVHVTLAYDGFIRDVRDGVPLALIGSSRQRLMWRLFGLPQVLWFGHLPAGAKSPRELRPPSSVVPRQTALETLNESVREFERVANTAASQARRSILHPYFGGLSLLQSVRLCAVHTRHHVAAVRNAEEH
jgi:hypothetical protein